MIQINCTYVEIFINGLEKLKLQERIVLGTLIVEPKATVFDKIFSLNSNVYQFVLIDNNHHIFRNTTELSEQNIFELVENKCLNTQTYKYTASSFSTSINNLQLLLITNQSLVYKNARMFVILLLFPSILALIAIIGATTLYLPEHSR